MQQQKSDGVEVLLHVIIRHNETKPFLNYKTNIFIQLKEKGLNDFCNTANTHWCGG